MNITADTATADRYSILSFGTAVSETKTYIQGDWYPHKWNMITDSDNSKYMSLKLSEIKFGDRKIIFNQRSILGSLSRDLVTFGNGQK